MRTRVRAPVGPVATCVASGPTAIKSARRPAVGRLRRPRAPVRLVAWGNLGGHLHGSLARLLERSYPSFAVTRTKGESVGVRRSLHTNRAARPLCLRVVSRRARRGLRRLTLRTLARRAVAVVPIGRRRRLLAHVSLLRPASVAPDAAYRGRGLKSGASRRFSPPSAHTEGPSQGRPFRLNACVDGRRSLA